MPDNTASTSSTNTPGDQDNYTDNTVPTNVEDNTDDGLMLPDLESKKADPPTRHDKDIDLPEQNSEAVTLPEFASENDELENELLGIGDNSMLLRVNDTRVPDFAKEMSIEEGLDCDLELELENLTFLENNHSGNCLQAPKKKPNKNPKGNKPRVPKNKSANVMPSRITRSASMTNKNAANENVPRSPKGEWKTTRHVIKRK